ncbi:MULTISPECIES: hypothetical protein [Enterovibrio]|uniref:Lipoprotein n=1 Tax=Enterovibrio norvegicus FF-454 TaxID=1185651 RepID=A0A1E5BZY2_9GAMM|nr:hypothetical protein [Enterovibrio norvegicus]OEE58824.1 hypothetical protein A1OK_02130 [Enterovibrio norvegicus FF-454]OEE74156.1 hypothetical protein A1OQ_09705 [Enterovibrio norvegicus FF-162]
MKHWAVLVLPLVLGGCQNSLVNSLPASDYQGKVPDGLNQKLLVLNDAPIQSSRGATTHFIYEEDKALLTIVEKLRSNRWYWNMNKSEVADDIRFHTCNQYGEAINQGLGVRTWFVNGFVTDVISAGDCN